MTQNETVSAHAPTSEAVAPVADSGKVRVGAGFRLLSPAATDAETKDRGKVRVGAGFRLLPPATAPAEVSDAGTVRVGAGFRLATH